MFWDYQPYIMGIRPQNMPQTSNSLLSPTKFMVARGNHPSMHPSMPLCTPSTHPLCPLHTPPHPSVPLRTSPCPLHTPSMPLHAPSAPLHALAEELWLVNRPRWFLIGQWSPPHPITLLLHTSLINIKSWFFPHQNLWKVSAQPE